MAYEAVAILLIPRPAGPRVRAGEVVRDWAGSYRWRKRGSPIELMEVRRRAIGWNRERPLARERSLQFF